MKTVLLLTTLAALALSASAPAGLERSVKASAAPPPLQLRSSCVTRAERRHVVRFRAADGIRLIGVELGKGPRGLVLSHGYHQSVCDWVGQARRLARAGYRVLVFDHRNHGSSTYTRKRYWRIDHDVVGAVRALRARGARTVVLAGSSMGATAVLVGASELRLGADAVVSLSAPTHISTVDAEAAVGGLTVPTLFVAAEDDDPFDEDARTLFAASAAREKQLEMVPASDAHGTGLLQLASIRTLFDEFLRSHSDQEGLASASPPMNANYNPIVAQVLPAERDLRRVIGDGDAVPDGEVEGLTDHDLVELYRSLVLLRTYDERSVVYHRQGRIGTYAIFWNHEAIQAGSAYALDDDDWIFPSYRESAIGLLRGMPVSTVLSWWRGHPAGWWNPADYNVASICVPIGTHVPHAAGLAWGKKLRGEKACAIVYFGDGATSEGSFHEGANLAAVTGAPLVLLCNNNQWAISTPLEAQTRAESLADKAVGYGIPGVRVDGLDILAVFEATREAVERARAGEGPTFIEAVHYRAAPHATADDPKAYIDLDRVEEERGRECVARFEGYLRRAGILTDEMAESIRGEAAEQMREGIAAAEAEPPPDPALLFEHAFVDPPPSFERDLAELRRILGSGLG